ncbi:MAG: hypothetical protein LQ340_000833 [Diploschistes diacapsis]|nr:MAG: hypothetical protein LQ340_000833 [Diploschistes diacapsis]
MRHLELTTKWLSSKQQLITGVSKDDVNVDYFGQIPGTKRIDFRVEWERSVEVDSSKKLEEALIALRMKVEEVAENGFNTPTSFTPQELKWVINVASGLLTEGNGMYSKVFLKIQNILGEIADVLNMRTVALMIGLGEKWFNSRSAGN